MLSELLGHSSGNWNYNEYGKPYLVEEPFFSISHCKEGVVVVIDNQPIGIDIEAVRHADKELIERTMTKAEQDLISNAKDPNRAFTNLWTRKEAVVKAQGVGICSFEQLQTVLEKTEFRTQSEEHEKYTFSIAYK